MTDVGTRITLRVRPSRRTGSRWRATIDKPRRADDGATCTSCGDLSPWNVRWCEACGARLLPASCYSVGS